MPDYDLTKWIWFSNAATPGSKLAGLLLLSFESAEEIYDYNFSANDDFDYVLSPSAKAKLSDKSLTEAKSIRTYCDENDIFIIPYCDERYPKKLRMIQDPPALLYCKGKPCNFNKGVFIGTVGTRKCSRYGINAATNICEGLASAGVTIVSGMASGIDKFTHIAALNSNAMTVAVLGCGVDMIYPKENEPLYHNIRRNGLIISEYPPLFKHSRTTFPERNRIISGISDGVLVIEAPEHSGALITANRALNQGRALYSVPGNIDSPTSEGTNSLIQQGAKMVTSALDIIVEYQMVHPETINPLAALKRKSRIKRKENTNDNEAEPISKPQPRILDDGEKEVYNSLSSIPKSAEEISEDAEVPMGNVLTVLTVLEMSGAIKRLPGDLFVRTNIKDR